MLEDLIEGYRRYRNSWTESEQELYRQLVEEGQSPKVMVIACCDSRVDPSIILDAKPGSLFMLRNVANLVPAYEPDGASHSTSAALEFAVRHIAIEHIIVMGHAHCGGIRALYEAAPDSTDTDFILPWMRIVTEARHHVHEKCNHLEPSQQRRAMEQEAIRVSIRNLLGFPWIKRRVDEGTLHLHGWYYALAEGLLMALEPASGEFKSLLADS